MKFSDQVASTLRSIHPSVKKDIRRALDDLAAGRKRDTKALTPPLDGFSRLRVGKYRVIYRHDPRSGEIIAEFLGDRKSVYQNFIPSPSSSESEG